MSNIKETIRAEIDRRYEENREKARYDDYYRGMNDGLDHFEQFLDTLEEPVSEDLEEAADKYEQDYFTDATLGEAFIAGAEWQKEQDMGEWLKDRDGCFWDGVNEGKKAMEEQMLKDAVEGVAEELYNDGEPQCTVGVGAYFKPGDEVYVIPREEKDD